jgi:hypothetical protein
MGAIDQAIAKESEMRRTTSNHVGHTLQQSALETSIGT